MGGTEAAARSLGYHFSLTLLATPLKWEVDMWSVTA